MSEVIQRAEQRSHKNYMAWVPVQPTAKKDRDLMHTNALKLGRDLQLKELVDA
jgi:hypothetical protein